MFDGISEEKQRMFLRIQEQVVGILPGKSTDQLFEVFNRLVDFTPNEEELANNIVIEMLGTPDPPAVEGPMNRPKITVDHATTTTTSTSTENMEMTVFDVVRDVARDREAKEVEEALKNSITDQGPSTSQAPNYPQNLEELVRDRRFTAGLFNTANTCWFNCVAQMMYSVPKFRSLIYHGVPCTWEQEEQEDGSGGGRKRITNVRKGYEDHAQFVMLFRSLFAELQFTEKKYLVVREEMFQVIDRLFRKRFQISESEVGKPSTVVGRQQDASELFMAMMEWFDDGLKTAIHALRHPSYSNEEEDEAPPPTSTSTAIDENMVVDDSTSAPLSTDDIAPPEYPMEDVNMPTTSNVHRAPKSRPNSPVKPSTPIVPMKQELTSIDEAMDTMETPAASKTFVKPAANATFTISKAMKNNATFSDTIKSNPPNPDINMVENATFVISDKVSPVAEKSENPDIEEFIKNLEDTFRDLFAGHRQGYNTVTGQFTALEDNSSLEIPTLQVRYGNLHDALEDYNSTGVQDTLYLYNRLPGAFFCSLSRYQHHNSSSVKLHNRFEFPRRIYMDRYVTENREMIVKLRAEREAMREELSAVRARLRGLREYPLGGGVTRIADAFQTVLEAVTDMRISEPPTDHTHDAFIGPLSQSAYTQNKLEFVKDSGKIYPQLGEQPDSELAQVLRLFRRTLLQQEQDLIHREEELKEAIDLVYEVQELKKIPYDLHAIIVHSGDALRGHYWTYKLKYTGDGETQEWERINDQYTEKVDWERAEKEAFGTGNSSDPSAYVLMYLRGEDASLVAQEQMDEETAHRNLPQSLQDFTARERTEFRERLQLFRAGPSADSKTQEATEDTFSWYRKPSAANEEATATSETFVIGDENANPKTTDHPMTDEEKEHEQYRKFKERWLCARLDMYDLPQGFNDETVATDDKTRQLWNFINSIEPSRYPNLEELLNTHLRDSMMGPKGGRAFIEKQLGYPIGELTTDAENDIERVYETFVTEFLATLNYDYNGDEFIRFVWKCFPGLEVPLVRYLLVRALAVSDNFGLLAQRAFDELRSWISARKGVIMVKIAHLVACVYEVWILVTWGCRVALENAILIYNKTYSATNREVEISYTSLLGAKNARASNRLLYEICGFLGQDAYSITRSEYLEHSTVVTALAMTKAFIHCIATRLRPLQEMEFLMSKSERRIFLKDMLTDTKHALNCFVVWKTQAERKAEHPLMYFSDPDEEKRREFLQEQIQRVQTYDKIISSLLAKIEMISMSQEITTDKEDCANQLRYALQSVLHDQEKPSDALDPQHLGIKRETEKMREFVHKFQVFQDRIDDILKTCDQYVSGHYY